MRGMCLQYMMMVESITFIHASYLPTYLPTLLTYLSTYLMPPSYLYRHYVIRLCVPAQQLPGVPHSEDEDS
jgi:hypothetical protein